MFPAGEDKMDHLYVLKLNYIWSILLLWDLNVVLGSLTNRSSGVKMRTNKSLAQASETAVVSKWY